LTIGVQEIETL